MSKKKLSTCEEHLQSLSKKRREEFDKGYHELLLSELLLAMMEEDSVSVRALAKEAGISPTIIQGIRSGKRENVTVKSFVKILHALGYSLVAKKGRRIFSFDFLNA